MSKIYKIDNNTNRIIQVYNSVSSITTDVSIYRVLNGKKLLYKDGYKYRKEKDIIVNEDSSIVIKDNIHVDDKHEKMLKKYSFAIELIQKGTVTNKDICRICKCYGINLSEPTCKKLRDEFGNK